MRSRSDDVRFGYQASQPVLDGFDLTVAGGEVVALVGSSGSGKSTVTALLPRFYDVASGTITVDGVDVRDVTLDSLRRQVGVVFEDAFLFSDSIRSNIAYGRPDATDAEVRAAAVAAGAERFIDELSSGYDTVVGERGLTLSGGQRQRIALARAIITNPRVLVLDDATSAVDATTEQAIHDTLREIMEDRTTILIAHRRSTLRLANRIVVIDGGRVVDQGTHEELLVSSARYRDLLGGPDIAPDSTTTPRSHARSRPSSTPCWRSRTRTRSRPTLSGSGSGRSPRRRGWRSTTTARRSPRPPSPPHLGSLPEAVATSARPWRPRPSCWPRSTSSRRPRTRRTSTSPQLPRRITSRSG